MTYLTTRADVINDAEQAAAAAFSRSGFIIGPDLLDEHLAEIAEKATGTWIEYRDAMRLGRDSQLPYPTAAVTDLLAVVAALRAALSYSPSETATEVTDRVSATEKQTVAGDPLRLHLVAQHGVLVALGSSDRLAVHPHRPAHVDRGRRGAADHRRRRGRIPAPAIRQAVPRAPASPDRRRRPGRPPVNRDTVDIAQAWAAATSFTDLSTLTADWLARRFDFHPAYAGPADDLDRGPRLRAALIAANRAGYLTVSSQHGHRMRRRDPEKWWQHAAVEGFATPDVVTWLRRLVDEHRNRYRIVVHPLLPPGQEPGEGVPVTGSGSQVTTVFGGQKDFDVIDSEFPGCGPAAVVEVAAGAQVTVYAIYDGPSTLWRDLEAAALAATTSREVTR